MLELYLYAELLIWVAAFGFSEIFIEMFEIKSIRSRALYYTICAILGISIMNYV